MILTSLYCMNNGITSLSLKKLPALHTVIVVHHQLSALEVNGSVLHIEGCVFRNWTFEQVNVIDWVYCSSNKLTDLDTSIVKTVVFGLL